MANYFAFTDIDHGMGKDENGDPIVAHFSAGQPVKGLDEATMRQLIESGAIASYNRLEVEAAGDAAASVLAAENAELKAQLEAALSQLATVAENQKTTPPAK